MNQRFVPLLAILFFVITFNVHARNWQAYSVPGAYCGSGAPYKVWVDIKDPHRLAIEFMGGGACWSKETCYGKQLKAWMFNIPRFPALSVFSSEHSANSPAHQHSMIYFPYCTGDVHAGDHKAEYLPGQTAYHTGRDNIVRAMNYLGATGVFDFAKTQEVLVYGASAGALGALLHTQTIDRFVPPKAKRVLIADAPGLHFGKEFWKKFSEELFDDYREAFRFLVEVRRDEGFMAKYLPQVCQRLSHWDIGILQGAQDLVMSQVFGDISPSDHRKLIYGPQGAYQQASFARNCATWAPDTKMHTFLIFGPASRRIKAGGKSAVDFLFDIYHGKLANNYK